MLLNYFLTQCTETNFFNAVGQPNLEVVEQVNEGDQTTAKCSAQIGSQPLKLLDKALLPHISLQVGQDVIVSNNTYTTVDLTNIVTAVSGLVVLYFASFILVLGTAINLVGSRRRG